MIRGVVLFLVVMALIGLLGKYRRPSVGRKKTGPAIVSARKCPRCGTYLIGDATCECQPGPDGS